MTEKTNTDETRKAALDAYAHNVCSRGFVSMPTAQDMAASFAKAVADKNMAVLETILHRMNPNSCKLFEALTGAELGKTDKSIRAGLLAWAGITPEQLAAARYARYVVSLGFQPETVANSMARRILEAVKAKDVAFLKRNLADGDPGLREFFHELTGVRVGKTFKDLARALDKWAAK